MPPPPDEARRPNPPALLRPPRPITPPAPALPPPHTPHPARPVSTAIFSGPGIAIGSLGPAIAEFTSSPSHPSSIASAASDAVPTPASTITGTFACSRIIRRLNGLRIPIPDPIGAASGITAAHPISASLRHVTGSSVIYGRTL